MSDPQTDAHALHSMLRERIVEHIFIGEALRHFWRRGVFNLEVMRAEFDSAGYDIVLGCGPVTRHIQLKAVLAGGARREVKAAVALEAKPSGCIIVIEVDHQLAIRRYRWFGGDAGLPLPSIADRKVARHAKGNALGHKAERPAHRVIPLSAFTPFETLDALLDRLFDPSAAESSHLS